MAQNGKSAKFDVREVGAGAVEKCGGLKNFQHNGMQKSLQKITLADNQKLMGPYYTDDVASSEEGLGLPTYPGELGVASLLDVNELKRFDGGKISQFRYGLANAATVKSVFIYLVNDKGQFVELFNEKVTEASAAGWNDVTLSQSYTLDLSGATEMLMGYYYEQSNANNGKNYNVECYPLSITGNVSTTTLVYGNLGQGQGWYNVGTDSYGSLSVQAVVEKEFSEYDLSLGDMSAYAFNKAGENETFTLTISSYGKKVPQSYTLDVAVDGKPVASYDTPVVLSDATLSLEGTVKLPSDLAPGKHTMTVTVAKINGEVPANDTDDDTASATFTVYDKSFPHQKQLVEHFTSTSCTYCPNGDNLLIALAATRDDIARVSVHGIQNPSYPDPFRIAECDVIMSYENVTAYPSASYNRMAFDFGVGEGMTVVQTLGYNASYKDLVAGMLSRVIDQNNQEYPAFATVNASANYNPADGKLTVKVNGEGVDNFATVMGADAVLNVCLVEDGIVSRQLDNGTWISAYTHNCVLRKYVSDVYGDAINWNGTYYENDYVIDWSSAWKAENMRVVAFVSRPLKTSDMFDMFVTNAEMAGLTVGDPAGVETVARPVDEVYETARYTADGVLLNAPQKGINIVRMSNGETRKVVVK